MSELEKQFLSFFNSIYIIKASSASISTGISGVRWFVNYTDGKKLHDFTFSDKGEFRRFFKKQGLL